MTTLIRTLRFRDLTLLIIGLVIGSGIFLVPARVLREVQGSIAVSLMVWLAGGVLSLLGALTYGELSAMNPKAGGLYVYIRDCFGRLPAFLFGWTLFVAISGGSVATLAAAFSNYVGEFFVLTDFTAVLVRIGMIAVVTAVNVWGTRKSSDLQNWTTAIKVGAILLMSVILLWGGNGFSGSSSAIWPARVDGSLVSGFGVAMISVLWAYEGWQYGTYSAGETIDPQRNFPRAFLIGTAVLIGIYMLANVSYLAALGPAQAAASDRIASSSVAAILNSGAAKLVAIAILISIFSATNSTALTSPRVFYAMAQDGLFFKKLSEVHPRFGTPAFAIIVSSVWSAMLASGVLERAIGFIRSVLAPNSQATSWMPSFQQLLDYVVFTGWIFYALGAACIFVYRKRMRGTLPPYQVPGYPWTPLLFIISAVALVGNTIIAQPLDAAKGLAMVLLGIPVYLFWRTRNRIVDPASEEVVAAQEPVE